MAEKSGFFQAEWDSSLMNPLTEEYTGWWDRNYLAEDFTKYFSLFVGNGVFVSPTNQLKVVPGSGLSVILSKGWAFANGCWYYNDEELVFNLQENVNSITRIDSIKIRLSNANRRMFAGCYTGEVSVIRNDNIYDLKVAEVRVQPFATSISLGDIEDFRQDENVCGFVKGLVEVVSTADLFSQFQGIFEDWFNSVKNQVTGDLAIRLQQEFNQINEDIVQYKDDVDDYYADVEANILSYKQEVQSSVSQYEQNVQQIVSGYNEEYTQTLNGATELVEEYVEKDFVIPLIELTFVNKQCIIVNEKVTSESLIDVYFNAQTINEAEDCQIGVESENGRILLFAAKQPESTLQAKIRVRIS